ncbi:MULTISPECIES: hypothetical protein [Moorena]|uniref:hypothetical protein n=1 Tax=Moorena TaxID=1155738 RepID=UPI000315250C|nr:MULTISPECIES: hypothetical protein [Moorena]NEQ07180.1 hypothetical protein [Moorena sp. SIO4E2]NER92033.1 hypothetical protein [Moorena sp. SIO3A2]NET68955.1 hypothetical protein [Moorena sp. SIO1G6]
MPQVELLYRQGLDRFSQTFSELGLGGDDNPGRKQEIWKRQYGWAELQHWLGVCLLQNPQGHPTDNVEQAIKAFELDKFPQYWAKNQNFLGCLLSSASG